MGLDLTSKKTLNILLGIVVALSLIIGVCVALQKTDSSKDKEEHIYRTIALVCSWSVFGLGAIILGVQITSWAMNKRKLNNAAVPYKLDDTAALIPPATQTL